MKNILLAITFSRVTNLRLHAWAIIGLLVLIHTGGDVLGQMPNLKQARINRYSYTIDTLYRLPKPEQAIPLSVNGGKGENLSGYGRKVQPLLSQLALNRLFAQKLAYYSSGSNATTLFDNYVILDPSSGRLTLGYNKGIYASHTNTIKSVLSIALQTSSVVAMSI